jgi:diaminopimelate epimerase
MKFVKLSGLGNDFILIDNRKQKFSGEEREFFKQICQRRTSIGADGVILLENSRLAHFKYRHFNADGSFAEMCGNGARAVCHYAVAHRIAPSHLTFEVNNRLNEASVDGNLVKIKLSRPEELNLTPGVIGHAGLQEGGFLRIGVPHLVFFVNAIEPVDVATLGRYYRNHTSFQDGANVNFVEVIDEKSISIRTYERGVEAETLACGTGSIAAAIISHLKRKMQPPITVKNTGGNLVVDWGESFSPLFLQGKTQIVYYGDFKENSS